jgi:hypothetical protein
MYIQGVDSYMTKLEDLVGKANGATPNRLCPSPSRLIGVCSECLQTFCALGSS